jgi:hypothetical protein
VMRLRSAPQPPQPPREAQEPSPTAAKATANVAGAAGRSHHTANANTERYHHNADAIEELCTKLRWRGGGGIIVTENGGQCGGTEEDAWCSKTGTSLLFWATVADNFGAVRNLLREASWSSWAGAASPDDITRGLKASHSALCWHAGYTPIHAAMMYVEKRKEKRKLYSVVLCEVLCCARCVSLICVNASSPPPPPSSSLSSLLLQVRTV